MEMLNLVFVVIEFKHICFKPASKIASQLIQSRIEYPWI